MKKILIEMIYQRVPKPPFVPGDPETHVASTVYNGKLQVRAQDASQGMFHAPFENQELQDVAAWLHHLVRFASSLNTEFAVVTIQKPPHGGRGVEHSLSPGQINKLYESEESAREFFAPTIITRGEADGTENE